MGSFFTNLHIRAKEPLKVVDLLRPLVRGSRALISPEKDGWVTVFPESTEDQDVSKLLVITQKVSRQLESAALATLLHDSDVFCYFLYENGRQIDEYNSRPDYFEQASRQERAAARGNPSVLIRFCKESVSEWQLKNILGRGLIFKLNPFNWLFAEGIAKALAACLGIPANRALSGFKYANHGGLNEDLSPWLSI